MNKIVVKIPATSANLGPGFDCLAIALTLYNTVTLIPDTYFRLDISGEGEQWLPRDRNNLVARTVDKFFARIGRGTPEFALQLNNRIPMTGGIGSSSAALIGALLAANAMAGSPLNQSELLEVACEEEGHPDNVSAALVGGFIVAVMDQDRPVVVSVPVPEHLRIVTLIPGFSISTSKARDILRPRVSRRDAVFNLSRCALFVTAMQQGRLEFLRVATQDRLHQPQRQQLFPAMPDILQAALDAGAVGSFLSGAGSALVALTIADDQDQVSAAMSRAANELGVGHRIMTLDVAHEGASVRLVEG